MISFIVPAHNEESCLGRTLQAVHASAQAVGLPYEIIVVDDASTDATARIAQEANARVVSVNHRQIAATRNSGARASAGDRLFFVDADTIIDRRVVASALRKMDQKAAGGGATVRFDGKVPLFAILLLGMFNLFMRLLEITGGAFMFCTRDAFRAVGGFDEKLYGGEDAAMSWALKREGRFVVLWNRVVTSGRRVRGMNGLRMVAALLRMAFFPKMLERRSSVHKVWYDSNRGGDDRISGSITARLSNFVLLLIMLAMITGPIWALPWPEKYMEGPLGTIRFVSYVVGLHIGMVVWPCIYFLVRILARQTRWQERIKLVALIVLSLWLVWGNTLQFIRFWTAMYGLLVAPNGLA